jgi:outer membrane protein, multidrug efflux system
MTLGAAGVMALAGCAVGPDYVALAPAGPERFAQTDAAGFARTSAPSDGGEVERSWWKTLNDPMLDSLIDRAIAGNLDVRLAEERIREARLERFIAAADSDPTLNLDGGASRRRNSQSVQPAFGPAVSNSFQAGFDANWEIDVWGRVKRATEAADASVESAMESRRDVLVSLLAEVARNYADLRGFQQRSEIARKNIKLQSESVGLTQARFDAGLTNEVDVAQAKSVLATTQATLPTLDDGVQRAAHRLGVLIGGEPTALLGELTSGSASGIPGVPSALSVGLPSELLRRRPDVRRAERELAAATARVGVATAELYPRFSISGAFGLSSSSRQGFESLDARFWSVGPAMRWPIFQAGKVRAGIGVANARVDQALTAYERSLLTSFEDVENALSSYTREQARRARLQEAVDANRRAFELANQLYTTGLTDFLRVLDSQRALFLSEDQLSDSDRTVTTNLIAVYKALGGGWEAAEPVRDAQVRAAEEAAAMQIEQAAKQRKHPVGWDG